MGESWTQQTRVSTVKEHRHAQALIGQFVAVSLWDTTDQAMQPQSTQVVAHAPGTILFGVFAEQTGEWCTQLRVVERLRFVR